MTILFWACSKCAWPEYAIRKTDSIRFYLKNRNIIPNHFGYLAMISAYGRAGAIYEAFNVVDEMLASGIKLRVDVFTNLLCACIEQREGGYLYALKVKQSDEIKFSNELIKLKIIFFFCQFYFSLLLNNKSVKFSVFINKVWQMCLTSKIRPNVTMYNLLLKCAADCSTQKSKSSDKVKKIKPKISSNISKNLFPVNSKEYQTFYDNSILNKEEQERFLNEAELSNKSHFTFAANKRESENNNEKNENLSISNSTTRLLQEEEVSCEMPKSNTDDDIVHIRPENVHVIDDLTLVGQALDSKMKDLEWWQDIEKNISKEDLLVEVAKHNSELSKKLAIQKHQSVLTRVINLDEIVENLQMYSDDKTNRFNIIGGIDGFISSMSQHKATPRAAMFNTMLQVCGTNRGLYCSFYFKSNISNACPTKTRCYSIVLKMF
jgi:pentatricopeptide repeat protein